MSYDIWTISPEPIPVPHPDCQAPHRDQEPEYLAFAGNMTSNVAPVWCATGCDLAAFDGKHSDLLRPVAQAALTRLVADPRAYDHHVRGGGAWGTVESAIDYLGQVVAMCDDGPGVVRVCR